LSQVFRSILSNRIPGQVVVQITDRCNARCPQCGMRVTESFARSTLETDTIKRMIDAAACRGVQAISFTGGEPLLDLPRLVELIRYAGGAGIPFIRTGTNGFMLTNPEKKGFEDRVSRMVEQLADSPLRNFWISLDSAVDHVHDAMRGFPGVVAGIAKALPIFHQAGIYPAVNLGINRNVGGDGTRLLHRKEFGSDRAYLDRFYSLYVKAFDRFYQRAIDLGFTMANTCYPMSIDVPECDQGLSAVYAATTVAEIVRFSPMEKRVLFKALIAVIRRFRSKIRIFSPLCSLASLIRQYSHKHSEQSTYGCRGGVDFFFVNAADGHTYPCGYRGNEDFGRLWDLDRHKLNPVPDDACRQCDWECFRDPSELFGPLLETFSNPLGLIRRLADEPGALATWAGDLFYYWACGFFNGRRPPDFQKLRRFSAYSTSTAEKSPLAQYCRFNQKLSVS
jgi:hypothetical protein